jgi:poly(3-hydroxybutyrate) depolymerase
MGEAAPISFTFRRSTEQPTPVVLTFHDGGSNAEQMVRFCGLNEKAD